MVHNWLLKEYVISIRYQVQVYWEQNNFSYEQRNQKQGIPGKEIRKQFNSSFVEMSVIEIILSIQCVK